MATRQKYLILRISIAAAAVAVVTSLYWMPQGTADRALPMVAPTPSLLLKAESSPPQSNHSTKKKDRPMKAELQTIRKRFRNAQDYFALAKEILPQAKAGDPEAQYVLFKTYNDCKAYAWEADNASLDAARDKALHLFPEHSDQAMSIAESGYQKCHGFYTDEAKILGDAWDWLQKATDSGYPAAQAATANERLLQDHLKSFVKAGAIAEGVALMPPIGGDANPRDLLAAAIQSEDPDALATFGELQNMLNPSLSRVVNQIDRVAWDYMACQRGADCSNYGELVPMNCQTNDSNCPGVPKGLIDMVNGNWAPVQDKVNEFTAALKSKQLDQLGLGTGG